MVKKCLLNIYVKLFYLRMQHKPCLLINSSCLGATAFQSYQPFHNLFSHITDRYLLRHKTGGIPTQGIAQYQCLSLQAANSSKEQL